MTSIEVVREARESGWRRAREIAAAVALYPRTIWQHRDILANFYVRDLRARFRGTLLGFAWPFALPLMLFLVYYFVFVELLGAKLGSLDLAAPGISAERAQQITRGWFTVYLFVGVVVWTGFAESVLRSSGVILENSNLIKKISFPSEILPLNVVLTSTTIQSFALIAYLALAPAMGWNPISWKLVALPALLAAQIVFSLGIALAVAAVNVFLRDTAQILGIAMTFWQFLTPVFWSELAFKDQIEPYRFILKWNPMYHLLDGYRKVMVNPGLYRQIDASGALNSGEWPWRQCAIVTVAGLALLVVGYAIFLVSKRKFADEL